MTKVRPFLKWAGNKYQCLDAILASLPQGTRLIEPFAGSGAIFINSNYKENILAELNTDLINLYSWIKQEGSLFIDYCKKYFTIEYNQAAAFNRLREKFNHCQDLRERAALFIYLNRHGYNGLCRYNKSGFFNVPFGRYKTIYFPQKEMLHFHDKSQHAQFIYADFRETFKMAMKGDVIYCDPPYVPLSASANFSSYTTPKFREQDQIDLVSLAKDCANTGITVLISNHDTEFTRHHYQSAETITSFHVKRSISCKADRRLKVLELLAVFR